MTMTEPAPGLSISEAAAETGLTTSTLRYYEQEGLLRGEIDRASSSHRRYSPEDVAWVGFITKLRSTGMPIRDIRRYTELARQGEITTPARLALLVEHRERVLSQLAEIQQSLAAIDFKIATYERFSTR
ncbi:MAG TPA: MerR family transcriptional regulator [Pseudolysinimonas sp.]|jgi:DNA-binding transcriptional MerR regulator|nr:MerR family transcriptional regulator [Pseudolysinimonas sp.]